MIRKYFLISLLVIVLIFSLFFNTSCGAVQAVHYIFEKAAERYDTDTGEADDAEVKDIIQEEFETEDYEEAGFPTSEDFEALDAEIIEEEKLSEETKEENEKAQEAEYEEGFEDYPEEPITYKGVIGDNDYFIDLIVDFEGKEVTGIIYNDWGISYLTVEIKGNIDLFRYSIEADCNGYFVNKETDTSEEAHMKINGYLSENLNNFSGSLVVEGFGSKAFTAERE